MFFDKNDKYDINPEDNVPQKVYGVPNDFYKNDKYNIDAEDNVPREVYGIPNSMRKNKYDVDVEKNVPEFVYGPPDYFLKKSSNTKKEDRNVFSAFEGGYFGSSYYYFINIVDGNYQFRFGYSKGQRVENKLDDPLINCINHDKKYYDKFIKELSMTVSTWKDEYVNNDIMDGTQWSIDFVELGKKYYGSNKFPLNYKIAKHILDKYFNSKQFMKIKDTENYDIDAKDNIPYAVYGIPDSMIKKYDIDVEDNVPREVYGIPNAMKNKYDINPEDNVPQKVYGVPNDFYKPTIYSFRVEIKNNSAHYVMIVNHTLNPDKYDLLFHNLNNLDGKFVDDLSVNINNLYYKSFVDRLYNIIQYWDNNYSGNSAITWNIKINDNHTNKIITGNGGFPSNWNELIDLLSEYENIFKSKNKKDNNILVDNSKVNNSNDELAEKYLKEIEEEVDQELIKMGLLNVYDGKKIPAFGSCHTRWAIEKRILKERYNIDWQTPQERNPYVKYD